MYTCRTCKGSNFTADQMKNEPYLHANNRGICNSCTSKYETTRIMIARANKDPENYLSCDDCDGIFKKTQQGRWKKLRVHCPYCKSEDMSRY